MLKHTKIVATVSETFSEVFFHFFFLLISQALYAKGKECIKEKQRPFSLRIGLQR